LIFRVAGGWRPAGAPCACVQMGRITSRRRARTALPFRSRRSHDVKLCNVRQMGMHLTYLTLNVLGARSPSGRRRGTGALGRQCSTYPHPSGMNREPVFAWSPRHRLPTADLGLTPRPARSRGPERGWGAAPGERAASAAESNNAASEACNGASPSGGTRENVQVSPSVGKKGWVCRVHRGTLCRPERAATKQRTTGSPASWARGALE
jgi:hypothetical protein